MAQVTLIFMEFHDNQLAIGVLIFSIHDSASTMFGASISGSMREVGSQELEHRTLWPCGAWSPKNKDRMLQRLPRFIQSTHGKKYIESTCNGDILRM